MPSFAYLHQPHGVAFFPCLRICMLTPTGLIHTPPTKKKDSALPSSILRKVWRLSDLDVPHGQLSELEFYSALKLIGVAQTGVAVIDRAALTLEGFEVPVFGAAAYVLPAILKTALGLSDSDLNEFQEQWATVYATSAGGGDGDADSGTFNEIPPLPPPKKKIKK